MQQWEVPSHSAVPKRIESYNGLEVLPVVRIRSRDPVVPPYPDAPSIIFYQKGGVPLAFTSSDAHNQCRYTYKLDDSDLASTFTLRLQQVIPSFPLSLSPSQDKKDSPGKVCDARISNTISCGQMVLAGRVHVGLVRRQK